MNDLGKPWLATPDCMIQYCPRGAEDMLNPKLLQLLKLYGTAFDDDWYYYIGKSKAQIIKRTPVWFAQKRMPAEKPKDPFQKKLV
jgi:hypothetical protein